MKKIIYNISLLLAVAGFVASCSDNEGISETERARIDKLMTDISADSDIPVLLVSGNSSAAVTRASIESTKDEYFETDKIGVFMLANSLYDSTSVINMTNVDWSGNGGGVSLYGTHYPDKWSIGDGIYNLYADAKYRFKDDTKKDTIGTDIKWQDVKYYPYGSPYAYSFFAYHPYVSYENLERSQGSVVANISIDGTQDVIWGVATKDSLKQDTSITRYAFSAKYFHVKENRNSADSAKVVRMHFKHLLSKLKFKVTPAKLEGVDGSSSYEKATGVTINRIAITNAPSGIQLVVADLYNPDQSGHISSVYDNQGNAAFMFLKHLKDDGVTYTDSINVNPKITSTGLPVTQVLPGEIMIPPVDKETPYLIQIYITYEGKSMEMVIPMTLTQTAKLEEGKTYYVNLTIYAPEHIVLEATLGGWTDGEEGTFKKDGDDMIKVE